MSGAGHSPLPVGVQLPYLQPNVGRSSDKEDATHATTSNGQLATAGLHQLPSPHPFTGVGLLGYKRVPLVRCRAILQPVRFRQALQLPKQPDTMNTKEQASQLRLAADILETGHPFEFQDGPNGAWIKADIATPFDAIAERLQIRIILATPPDGRPLCNPGDLTADQVGVGYRLRVKDDAFSSEAEVWNSARKKWRKTSADFFDSIHTYRLPLSVSWPALPDSYAELKAALAAGKVIEGLFDDSWKEYRHPTWQHPVEPATKTIDLGPSDFPPGSVLRLNTWDVGIYVAPSVWRSSVSFAAAQSVTRREYADLRIEGFQINRSIPLTGKWNPDAWEPCSKQIPA